MTLVPGLVDSHIHPFRGTDGTRGADLNGLRTLDEVRGVLAAERARCAPGEWVLGWGLSYDAFHGERIGADAATLRRLASLGLTGGHAMLGAPALLDDVAELEERGDLRLRCVVPLLLEPDTTEEEIEELLALRDRGGRRWRAGAAKLFIDGVIDTGTAWLFEPGPHGEGTEPFWPDPGRYAEVVARFAHAGFQCATHAIGDRGVATALDAYRAAGPGGSAPHRIEHVETLRDEELPRFAAAGV